MLRTRIGGKMFSENVGRGYIDRIADRKRRLCRESADFAIARLEFDLAGCQTTSSRRDGLRQSVSAIPLGT